MVKRYDEKYDDEHIIESEDGDYVLFKDYEHLQQRLATAEAECAIYYEIAAAAIGEEQTIALRDAAMRRRRVRDAFKNKYVKRRLE